MRDARREQAELVHEAADDMQDAIVKGYRERGLDVPAQPLATLAVLEEEALFGDSDSGNAGDLRSS